MLPRSRARQAFKKNLRILSVSQAYDVSSIERCRIHRLPKRRNGKNQWVQIEVAGLQSKMARELEGTNRCNGWPNVTTVGDSFKVQSRSRVWSNRYNVLLNVVTVAANRAKMERSPFKS